LETGDSVDAQQTRVEEAVRDVADMGGLACEPEPTSLKLLACWPTSFGTSPAFISLHLRAADGGYLVSILESGGGFFSRPRHLCSIQDRLAERIDLRLGGVVERDPKITCPKRVP
jgi:hypothetical protein